jgi:hypothetical protein
MGIFDSIKAKAEGLMNKGKNTVEATTLGGMGIPGQVVSVYQDQRRALGIETPTGGTLFIVGMAMYTLFGAAMAFAIKILFTIFGFIWRNPVAKIILILVLLSLISYVFYYLFIKKDKVAGSNVFKSAKADFNKAFGIKEGFQTPKADFPEMDAPLLNLQPLAIKQIAYIGPKENGGTFDVETGVNAALKAGVRFFTFQIDYLESKMNVAKFGPPDTPILVYRDDSNTLISSNSADISGVATQLANYAFSEEVLNSTLPLIIYLHFNRAPSSIKAPAEYLKFLSKVAKGLNPLLPNFLVSTGEGTFVRQGGERYLLQTPVGQLQKKVIFMTNADTSLFRRTDVLGVSYDNTADLDYMTHIRVYADTDADTIGLTNVTSMPIPPAAVLVSYDRILALSEKDKDIFAQKGRERFVIAVPSQTKNPKRKDLKDMMTTMGVNAVLINIFGEDVEELKKKISIWDKNKFIHLKSPALQSMNGAVIPNPA